MLCILVTIASNPVLSNIKSFLKDNLMNNDLNKSNMFNHGVHGGFTNHYKLLNHGTYGPGGHVLGEGAGKVGLFNDDLSVPRAVIPGTAYDIRARKVINNGGKCCDCHGEHHGYNVPHSAALRGFSNMHMMHDRVHEILQPGYAEYMVRSRLGDRRYSVNAQYDLTNWNIINNNMAQRGKYCAYY